MVVTLKGRVLQRAAKVAVGRFVSEGVKARAVERDVQRLVAIGGAIDGDLPLARPEAFEAIGDTPGRKQRWTTSGRARLVWAAFNLWSKRIPAALKALK